jgi:hypothetical protein
LSTREEFLKKVEEAKEAVKDLDEPYRGLAFQLYLAQLLGSQTAVGPRAPLQATAQSTPSEIIANLSKFSNRELIGLILYYEVRDMSKQEIVATSVEWGRLLPEQWMDKKFAESTKGLVVPVETENGRAFRLSAQGRLEIEAKVKELAKA